MNNKKKAFKDKYLTLKETAEYFAVSRQAIYDWEIKGLLKPVKKFGRKYFKIEDLEKLDKEPE